MRTYVRARSGTRPRILHADLDSFYASVEQRDDPGLRGRPVIVGGGVVLAASYEAKAYGVRTAMGGRPGATAVPAGRGGAAQDVGLQQASDAVFEVFRDTSPLVEPMSVDEAFIDVGGLRRVSGTPVEIAARLRSDVRYRVGLPITVGIARTKFLAKVASQEAKPDGLLLVPPGRELAFLHPLPVRRLWGVGAVTADKLRAHGIETVADVAELSESTLASMVGGAMGGQLYALSRNIDRRRVTTGVRRRSVGAQRALGRAGNTHVGGRGRRGGDRADRPDRRPDARGRANRPDRHIAVAVQRLWPSDPVAHPAVGDVLDACPARHGARLVAAAAPLIAERGLTLVGFAVSEIDRDGAEQLTLPFTTRAEPAAVDAAVDKVRRRYGRSALTRGVLVGRDPGLEMPHLPD